MEAIVFDFKKSFTINAEPSNKCDLLRGKDFSSTLESLSKDNSSKESSQKTSKLNEDQKNIEHSLNKIAKESDEENLEEIKEVDEKKDYFLAYGNMVYFFNNISRVEDNSINNGGVQIVVVNDSGSVSLDENSEEILDFDMEGKEVFLENKTPDLVSKLDFIDKEATNIESKSDYIPSETHSGDVKVNIPKNKELKFEFLKVDEELNEGISPSYEAKLSYVEEFNDKMEFTSGQKNNSESSLLEKKQDTIEVDKLDEDIRLDDESFITMDKNGIRFVKDDIIQLDKSDNIDRKDVVKQIIDKVKINLSDGKNEIRVTLKPEVLGEMTMNIEVVKGSVTAKIMVDNQRTKEIIEGNLIQLKEGIKDSGLEIKTVEVFVGNNSDFDKHSSGQSNLRQNNKRVKLKPRDNKAVIGYGEQPIENEGNINEEYLIANSLNLLV